MSILKQLIFTPQCAICSKLGNTFCPSCIGNFRPFQSRNLVEVLTCYCAGDYSGWLRELIICYKNGNRQCADVLSHLLLGVLDYASLASPFTLIPIPSSPEKIKERGFDTISKLCNQIVRANPEIRMDNSVLFQRRHVNDQVGLSARQRQDNLKGAFGVKGVVNGTVVLVDDVVTTGATLNSAAKALRLAGAQRIFGLTLCGTPSIS